MTETHLQAPTPPSNSPDLTGWQLRAVQAVWVGLAVVILPMLLLGVPARFNQILAVLEAGLVPRMLLAEQIGGFFQNGRSAQLDAAFAVAIDSFHTLLWVGSATLIFLRQPKNRVALSTSAVLLVVGAGLPGLFFAAADANAQLFPWLPRLSQQLFLIIGVNAGMLLGYTLPTGRFGARWIRWIALLALGWSLSWPFNSRWLTDLLGITDYDQVSAFTQSVWIVWVSGIVIAFVVRYQRIWDATERQQTKWIAAGYMAALVGAVLRIAPLAVDPSWWFGPLDSLSPHYVWLLDYWLGVPISSLLIGLAPVTVAFAVLRYRLWDITPIGFQFVVYVLLTTVLGSLFIGAIFLLQSSVEQAGLSIDLGVPSIVVLTTLLITFSILPLRNQIQRLIDRRFHRSRLDQQERLDLLLADLRTTVEQEQIGVILTERLADELGVTHVTLYLLGKNGRFHLQHTTLDENPPPPPTVSLEYLAQGQLYARASLEPYALLIPLLSRHGGQTVLEGVLLLGAWATGQGFSSRDRQMLQRLSESAGTAVFISREISEKQAADARLQAYRRSPIGRSETIANNMAQQPAHALDTIYQLAQVAFTNPEKAATLDNLATALTTLGKQENENGLKRLALLAEGFNDLVRSWRQSSLLTIGLEAVVEQLERPFFQNQSEAKELHAAYHFFLRALTAVSITDILQIEPPDTSSSIATSAFAPIQQALAAYERVTTTTDQITYLVQALEACDNVEQTGRGLLPPLDGYVVEQAVAHWRRLTTRLLSDVQTRADVEASLVTRRIWAELERPLTLTIHLQNKGRGAAHDIVVGLLGKNGLADKQKQTCVKLLRPSEAEQVMLMLPHAQTIIGTQTVTIAVAFQDTSGQAQETVFSEQVTLLAQPADFTFVPNPYMVGPPLPSGSPLFFGRGALLDTIEAILAAEARNNLVLVGQRRMGKTSLLKQLEARLAEQHLVLFLDGQSLVSDPGLPSFLLRLATEISYAAEDLGIFVQPPTLADFVENPYFTFEKLFLTAVFNTIGSRSLILLLDEFEELETAVSNQRLDQSIFPFLRHLIQHTPALRIVFSGTHRLESLTADYWNVLFNSSLYRHISHLDHAEALHLIQEPVAPFGMVYDDLALDKLWHVTTGHPYFLQLLCHQLVDSQNRTQRSFVTIDDVNLAIEEVVSVGQAHIIFMWNESSTAERLVLLALCQLTTGLQSIDGQQVVAYLEAHDVALTSVVVIEALQTLVQRNILRLEILSGAIADAGNGVRERYRWHLWLFGLWIERHKGLGQVRGEMNEPQTA